MRQSELPAMELLVREVKIRANMFKEIKIRIENTREVPGGPVVRTPRFHYCGPGLISVLGTEIPRQTAKKKKYLIFRVPWWCSGLRIWLVTWSGNFYMSQVQPRPKKKRDRSNTRSFKVKQIGMTTKGDI